MESIGSHLILSSAHRYVGSGTAKPKTKGHKKRGLLQRILQYLRAKLLGKGLSLLEEAHGRWLRDPSHDLEIRLLTLLPNTEELKPYALLLEGLSWRSLESREKLLRYKCPFCSLCNACLEDKQNPRDFWQQVLIEHPPPASTNLKSLAENLTNITPMITPSKSKLWQATTATLREINRHGNEAKWKNEATLNGLDITPEKLEALKAYGDACEKQD